MCATEIEARLREGRLLVEQFEIVDVSGVVLSFRNVRGGFIDLDNQRETIRQLLIGLHRVESGSHFFGEREHLMPDAELRDLQISGRDGFTCRERQQIEKILRERILRIHNPGAVCRHAPESIELRIAQPRRLREVSLRNSNVLEMRLQ